MPTESMEPSAESVPESPLPTPGEKHEEQAQPEEPEKQEIQEEPAKPARKSRAKK